MTKRKERIEREIEQDLERPDMWEPLPEGPTKGGILGTQVSLRLDSADAELLRHVAQARGIGYTSLLREWIVERLRAEHTLLTSYTYETSGDAVAADVQVSSGHLHIRQLAVA